MLSKTYVDLVWKWKLMDGFKMVNKVASMF